MLKFEIRKKNARFRKKKQMNKKTIEMINVLWSGE
jgi:hypothetical protein